jgi:sugar phosphate isomerase/epimerase
MPHELSLAHLTCLGASPPALVALAGRCGYRHVGLRLTEVTGGDAWPIISDTGLLAETEAEMRACGVGVLDVELARLRPDTRMRDFVPMLETAARLGARHVLTQGHDDDWLRLARNFAAFCDLAARYDMTADLEFLTWTGVRGVAEAWALIQVAQRDNAGLMIDTLHFARSGCRLHELEAIPSSRFHYIQLADAAGPPPDTKEGLIFTAREDRLLPGEGDIDLEGILARLPADIPIAVEIPNSALAARMSDDQRVCAIRRATARLLRRVDALAPVSA